MSSPYVAPATGNTVTLTLTRKADNWKDNLAGWHCWKVKLAGPCEACGGIGKFYTLTGTETDVKRFANDAQHNVCETCQ